MAEIITIIGCGPGAMEYVTPAARTAIQKATLLIGARHLCESLQDDSLQPQRMETPGTIPEILAALDSAGPDERIAVLVTGDPGFRSLARHVRDHLGTDRCRTLPGISSLQVACARLGLTWENLRTVSAHGVHPTETPEDLATHDRIAILCSDCATSPWVHATVQALLPTFNAWYCRDLTLPSEVIESITPGTPPHAYSERRVLLLLQRKESPQ